jgi:hypothetical protein
MALRPLFPITSLCSPAPGEPRAPLLTTRREKVVSGDQVSTIDDGSSPASGRAKLTA